MKKLILILLFLIPLFVIAQAPIKSVRVTADTLYIKKVQPIGGDIGRFLVVDPSTGLIKYLYGSIGLGTVTSIQAGYGILANDTTGNSITTTGTFSVDTTTLKTVFEPALGIGTTNQYLRGDKTWQTLPSTDTTILIATKYDLTGLAPLDSVAWIKTSRGYEPKTTDNIYLRQGTSINMNSSTDSLIFRDENSSGINFITGGCGSYGIWSHLDTANYGTQNVISEGFFGTVSIAKSGAEQTSFYNVQGFESPKTRLEFRNYNTVEGTYDWNKNEYYASAGKNLGKSAYPWDTAYFNHVVNALPSLSVGGYTVSVTGNVTLPQTIPSVDTTTLIATKYDLTGLAPLDSLAWHHTADNRTVLKNPDDVVYTGMFRANGNARIEDTLGTRGLSYFKNGFIEVNNQNVFIGNTSTYAYDTIQSWFITGENSGTMFQYKNNVAGLEPAGGGSDNSFVGYRQPSNKRLNLGSNFHKWDTTYTNQLVSTNSNLKVGPYTVSVTGNVTLPQATYDTATNPWKYSSGNTIQRSSGNLGIGLTSPTYPLHVAKDWITSATTNIIGGFDNYNDQGRYVIRRANGTVGTPTALLNNEAIGQISWRGHDGTDWSTISNAYISAAAEENYTSGAQGTQLRFGTSAAGGVSSTQKMVLTSDGKLGIGTTAPGDALSVVGTISNGTGDVATGAVYRTTGSLSVNGEDDLYINCDYNNNDAGTRSINFGTNGGGSTSTILAKLTETGNLGIGTTAPPAKLTVSGGNIQVGQSGGDSVSISSGNSLRMYGNATVFDDLMFPFATGTNAGTGYPTYNQDSLWHQFVIDTTGVTKCIIFMPVQLPHRWKEGSTVYPHIHYHHTTGEGTPTFKIKYKWVNIGDPTGTWAWHTMSTTTGTTNLTQQMCYNSSGITASGKTISSILLCQIYLVSTTGATKTCGAYQVDFHIEQDALGSNTETSKN